MAIPAVGMNRCVGMAFVTELFFARVTLHTGHHQALLVFFTFNLKSTTVAGPKNFVPPSIQQFHVLGTDLSSREHTGLGIFG